MKKLILSMLLIVGLASVQPAQAGISAGLDLQALYGVGFAVGYGFNLTPLVEVGGEFATNSFSQNFPSSTPGVGVNGKLDGQHYGVFGKLNLPILPLKFHAGLHTGSLTVATAIQIAGAPEYSTTGPITGSYFGIGLEYKIAMFFIEPRLGYQSITINNVRLSTPTISDVGLRVGVAF